MDLRKKALALNALTAARTRGSEQLSGASGSQVLLPAAAAEAALTAAAASSLSSRAGAGTAGAEEEELKSSPVGRSESSGTRKVELGRTRESEVVMAAEDWNQGSGGW